MKVNFIKKFRPIHLLILLVLFIGVTVTIDLIRISSYKVYPRLPKVELKSAQNGIYVDLVNGVEDIDWSELDETLEFINKEYDTSDFRLVNLIRMIYEFRDRIPKELLMRIEETLFDFRYWWDEPDGNSMCYWSENHQILFASAAYLVGQKYPETIFSNSGMTGKQHMIKAEKIIFDWMEMRWNYGFTEFYSGVYYKEDIGAMVNFIDLANDEALVNQMKIVMDLLFYDIAAQNIRTMFTTVSGRAYQRNRVGGDGSTVGGVTQYLWGNEKKIDGSLMYGLMRTNYSPPPVLFEIAQDTGKLTIRQSNGMDIKELKSEGYYGTDNRSMMMQLAMEAFVNPEIVRNTLSFMRATHMFTNDFVNGMKVVDFTLLRWLHLEPALVNFLNPQAQGAAIQRGNTYTYKTMDYTLYAVQKYHPGEYGSQHHLAGMNIGNSFSIFHTHPAVEVDVDNKSPSYWVGYGHFPHVAQEGNVNLSIYNTPADKRKLELDLLDYTHAYFPKEKFDSVMMIGNYAFGKKDNTFCAFIGASELIFRDSTTDDLIQQGKQSFWITEAGSTEKDRSFEQFIQRILANQVSFDVKELYLNYQSNNKQFELTFDEDFKVDGQVVNTNYERYDSPYIQAERKAKELSFTFNDKSLFLDFENNIRRVD